MSTIELQKITVGRRKRAVARVILRPGSGQIFINGKPLADYFPQVPAQLEVLEPLRLLGVENEYDVIANVRGGGWHGQAGAVKLGIARYLVYLDPSVKPKLRQHGLLTRDPREKERKKYGHLRARKKPQYHKR